MGVSEMLCRCMVWIDDLYIFTGAFKETVFSRDSKKYIKGLSGIQSIIFSQSIY